MPDKTSVMNKKILVIDDESSILTFLEKRLSCAGYQVKTINNAEEGIKIAEEISPDLIILDILMPGMDGTEAAEKLRQNDSTKNIPIMFLSCLFSSKDEISGNKEIERSYYLAKPYNPKELLREIERIVKK